MLVSDAWEEHAHDWIRWARSAPGDGFRDATWPELAQMLPPPDGLVVDLGCGEGRLGRELTPLGYHVVGLDRSPTLARAARAADPSIAVVLADAAHVPLRDGCAQLVVACMSLLDMDDLDSTLGEASRVLGPRGVVCAAIVHPFASAQDANFTDDDHPRFTERYLDERRTEVVARSHGVSMTFVSMHRPLARYVSALGANGFAVAALREYGTAAIPWLLVLRAEKHDPGG